MSQNDMMMQIEARNIPQRDAPLEFEIGDTVDVHVQIKEGEKTRIQVFTGTVIARRGGGLSASFTVRRLVNGEGVERTWPLHCPSIKAVKVKRHGVIRRAKLYFLRDRIGKATRLKERIVVKKQEEGASKKRTRKRGAKAKAERKKRAEAEGRPATKKGKRKGKRKGKKKGKAEANA